jgi:hypothetical protein
MKRSILAVSILTLASLVQAGELPYYGGQPIYETTNNYYTTDNHYDAPACVAQLTFDKDHKRTQWSAGACYAGTSTSLAGTAGIAQLINICNTCGSSGKVLVSGIITFAQGGDKQGNIVFSGDF